MADREDLRIRSNDGQTPLKVVLWKPSGDIRAILQLSHGMVEHIERYGEFAAFMADHGILVVGSDHLGHGGSVTSEDKRGYFCEKDPSEVVVDDLYKIGNAVRRDYPDLPYFILGHSMGSFIVRNYITKYGAGLSGAIICGSGDIPNGTAKSGLLLIKFLELFKGGKGHSKIIDGMTIGKNDKYFKDSEYKSWLSKNQPNVDAYHADPNCGFFFTLNGYQTLMESIVKNNDDARRARTPKELPLFIISGADCCLGEFGKGLRKIYDKYKVLGIKDIAWKLYENDRHEILNETDRDVVYNDILAWINKKTER